MPSKDADGGQVVDLTARRPLSGRRQALGCPLTGCLWQSEPFPATGRHNPAAVAAYIEHIYDTHPEYRGLIDQARASGRAGAEP